MSFDASSTRHPRAGGAARAVGVGGGKGGGGWRLRSGPMAVLGSVRRSPTARAPPAAAGAARAPSRARWRRAACGGRRAFGGPGRGRGRSRAGAGAARAWAAVAGDRPGRRADGGPYGAEEDAQPRAELQRRAWQEVVAVAAAAVAAAATGGGEAGATQGIGAGGGLDDYDPFEGFEDAPEPLPAVVAVAPAAAVALGGEQTPAGATPAGAGLFGVEAPTASAAKKTATFGGTDFGADASKGDAGKSPLGGTLFGGASAPPASSAPLFPLAGMPALAIGRQFQHRPRLLPAVCLTASRHRRRWREQSRSSRVRRAGQQRVHTGPQPPA